MKLQLKSNGKRLIHVAVLIIMALVLAIAISTKCHKPIKGKVLLEEPQLVTLEDSIHYYEDGM